MKCVGGGFDESRAKHQIFWRIPNEHQLREDDQIGAETGGVVARPANQSQVAGDVADDRIDLGDGYREAHLTRLCHGRVREVGGVARANQRLDGLHLGHPFVTR
jgi:hypothetical protein